jgi:hypothetical protein
MTDPSLDREMLVLERARQGLAPSAAQRRATLARLAAAVALAPAAVPSPSSSNAPTDLATVGGLKTGVAFSLRVLITGVVSGILAGFGAGYFVSSQLAERVPPQGPSTMTSSQVRTPPAAPPEVDVMPPSLMPSGSVPLPSSRPSEVAAANSPASPRERIRRDSRRHGPAESADYDELSYVQRAQTALRNADPALALGLMRSLDELRPQGALAAERTVISVLAFCQLGRTAEARAMAAAALQRGNAPDVYRRRLESSCVGRMGEDSSDGSDRAGHQ